MSDFDPVELHWIGAIMRAERAMPDDFWAVEAVQELACILARIEPLLPTDMTARLVGIGAILARRGKDEMRAGITAARALQKGPICLASQKSIQNGG